MSSFDSGSLSTDSFDSSSLDFDVATVAVVASPVAAARKPTFRSVDGKTLADNFNKGQPTEPDYTWPGGRKFYQ